VNVGGGVRVNRKGRACRDTRWRTSSRRAVGGQRQPRGQEILRQAGTETRQGQNPHRARSQTRSCRQRARFSMPILRVRPWKIGIVSSFRILRRCHIFVRTKRRQPRPGVNRLIKACQGHTHLSRQAATLLPAYRRSPRLNAAPHNRSMAMFSRLAPEAQDTILG
jgi:hypothetical protein